MRESTFYQGILEEGMEKGLEKGRVEGRVEEARRLLLRLGGRRFGAPTPAQEAVVAAVSRVERLEELTERVLSSTTWEELLAPS